MSAPTPSPTVVPTAIPTATAIPQELLIGTYTEVLKASKDALPEVHQTANDILPTSDWGDFRCSFLGWDRWNLVTLIVCSASIR